jgi:GntR family transcriptional regulator
MMDWFEERKEPLYFSIKKDILSNIKRGLWPIGHRLPSEDELQEEYDVSRGTVRRALSELESEGYIDRRPGRGTFVTRVVPKLQKPLGEIVSFTQQLARAGLEPKTKMLFTGIIRAHEAEGRVQEGFGIPDDKEVIHVKRLRQGNGTPFAIQSVYFLPDLCPGILEEELPHLFKLYKEKYGRTIMAVDEMIQVAGASEEQADLLQVKPGTAVMLRDRVSFDQEGEPFEVLHSVDRGDGFVYRYRILNDRTLVPVPPEDDTVSWLPDEPPAE